MALCSLAAETVLVAAENPPVGQRQTGHDGVRTVPVGRGRRLAEAMPPLEAAAAAIVPGEHRHWPLPAFIPGIARDSRRTRDQILTPG
jgi:hypothetical protein